MSVLILSVHINHFHSQHWRRLQPEFVTETVGGYEYGTIVNGDDPSLYQNPLLHLETRTTHRQAISHALDIFRLNRTKFDHFLLLDSDCWPVRPDWMEILNRLMGDRYLYAAPNRTENFDFFPHPSAFYMKAEFLDQADFGFARIVDLLGGEVSDVATAMPKMIDGHQIWYPLLKTNYLSPHPLYASVYGDLFYHHCAGSRGLGFRANSSKFYDHLLVRSDHRKIYNRCTTQLLKNPRSFIDKLRGVGLRAVNRAGEP